ncbi:MAG: phosphopyruvate hydratase [bacterium]
MKIKDIKAREILDSRGNPTVEVKLVLENGIKTVASVASGASTGSREAIELRDGDPKRYNKKGVLKAVDNVNTIIAPALIGMEINQVELDKKLIALDGTENKSKLGANAILGVSIASIKALAELEGKEVYEYLTAGKIAMPIPMVNIINGGVHAPNSLEIQEFMIVPVVKTIKERVRVASEIFITLKQILTEKGESTAVGDEGGYAPNLKNTKEALDLIMQAIKESGYEPGTDVFIALDCAASEFFDEKTQMYGIDGQSLSSENLVKYYYELTQEYPIISIEDPFFEDDFESLTKLTSIIGEKIMLVGDDFFVSNEKYLQKGIESKAGNAILLKPNQIGTVTEFTKTILAAKKNNYKCVMSHRSGETTDTVLADFAIGFSTEFIKTGSMSRGERICKYNRLMEIEDNLN